MIRIPEIRFFFLLASLALGGCASTGHNPKDPFESFNRGMYQFNDAADKAVAKPAAKAYTTVVPAPARMMLSNFFSNLNDVIVTVNDLLQFKVVQAASDTGRVVVNTTVGLLGLVDIASPVGLEKHDEDFGQTLGRWGINNGPYLVLPVFGPSTVRDSVGLYTDSRASMIRKIKRVDTRNQVYVASLLGRRAALLDQETILDEAAVDRYAFIRDAYLQHRQSQVYDGNPPREKYDDDEEPGSKSDKRSANDIEEIAPPVAAGATSIAASIVAETLSIASPTTNEPSGSGSSPAVLRVWVSQADSIH